MRSLDQERAEFAWSQIPVGDEKFVDLAKGAPALIMANGLMQTLAFYQQKKHASIVTCICKWLAKLKVTDGESFDAVIKSLQGGDSDRYMRATDETLELLRWVRQFAAAKAAKTRG